MNAASGKIYVLEPARLGGPRIEIVGETRRHRPVRIALSMAEANAGRPAPGVHTMRMELRNPRNELHEESGFFAVVNGQREITWIPGLNEPPGTWALRIIHPATRREHQISFALT